jgi:hypothetical protein
MTLVGVLGALAAVAFGAGRHGSRAHQPVPPANVRHPRTPTITAHPDPVATSATAGFAFADRQPKLRFQCRLDGGRWRPCRSPVSFAGLASGSHAFATRAVDRRGRRSRAARFVWQLLEPKRFSIVPGLAALGELYPGAPPQPLPLTVSNPNPVPIFLTGLRVTVTAGPDSCAGAENLALGESGVSDSAPLEVPAEGSVSLPAPGVSAPTIQLRDLPVDQDGCQGASFPLQFTGSARG